MKQQIINSSYSSLALAVVFPTICAVSSLSLQDNRNNVMPTHAVKYNSESLYSQYAWENTAIAQQSGMAESTKRQELEDFEVIRSLANQLIAQSKPIDEDIQNIIDEHLWDIL